MTLPRVFLFFSFFATKNWLVLWGYIGHGHEPSFFIISHKTGWVQNTCTEAVELKREKLIVGHWAIAETHGYLLVPLRIC